MNADILQTPQLSTGRLLLLGLSSVVLCISFIVAPFAPFPLALAVILYGRKRGILTGLLGLLLTYVCSAFVYSDFTLFGFYFSIFVFGIMIAEIVCRGISPVKGLVIFGLSFCAIFGGGLYAYIKSHNITAEQFIIQQIEKSSDKLAEQKKIIEESGDAGSIEALQLLNNPKQLSKEIISSFPIYFFIGTFVMLWFNMFLVLKSRRLLMAANEYPYSESNLLRFKVPFGFIFLLVAGLVMAVWSEELGMAQLENVGYGIIYCLGVFYFFQGFGVFSDLLTFLGMAGFFRTIIVVLMILMAKYLIAAAGLFDNWFDFRKYFVKPKTED